MKAVTITKGIYSWVKGHVFTGGSEVFGFMRPPIAPVALQGTGYQYSQSWDPYQPPQVYANLTAAATGLGYMLNGTISNAPLNQNVPTPVE